MRLLRITTVPISLRILLRGQLEFMVKNGFEVLTVSSEGPDIERIQVPHRVVRMTRTITPIRDLIGLIQMIKLIREFRPDIIHTHTPKAGMLGMVAGWLCGVKVRIHTIGGLPWLESAGTKRQILKWAERLVIYCSTDILINSRRLKEILQRELPTIQKEYVVLGEGSSNGIDIEYFSANFEIIQQGRSLRAEHGITDSDHVFCFIGRLVTSKGLLELVESFKQLQKNHQHLKLFLIGPIEEGREQLPASSVDQIHQDKDIIVAGMVDDVRPWLAASDIFVFPSHREGFPNVLLQAGCFELPVIASNINGCNEIITHNKTGLLMTPKDKKSLLDLMTWALVNLNEIKQLGISLRKEIQSKYNQNRIWTELIHFYQKSIQDDDK